MEKLYVFGDSIAKGVIYDEEKGRYVYTPNSFLKLFEAKTGITIKNDSKFGCTAPMSLVAMTAISTGSRSLFAPRIPISVPHR